MWKTVYLRSFSDPGKEVFLIFWNIKVSNDFGNIVMFYVEEIGPKILCLFLQYSFVFGF